MSLDLVPAIASKVLDGLYARQTATAQNIANANSTNYAPVRVSFEAALKEAAALHMGDTASDRRARIDNVTVRIDAPQALEAEGVRLDTEITIASETSARYAMLLGMLDRTIQIRQLAIKGA